KAPHEGGEVLPDADLAGTMFNALGDFWDRALESIERRNKRGAPRQWLTPSSALQKIAYDHQDLVGILVVRVRVVAAEVRQILGQPVGLTHHDLDLVVPMRRAEPFGPQAQAELERHIETGQLTRLLTNGFCARQIMDRTRALDDQAYQFVETYIAAVILFKGAAGPKAGGMDHEDHRLEQGIVGRIEGRVDKYVERVAS